MGSAARSPVGDAILHQLQRAHHLKRLELLRLRPGRRRPCQKGEPGECQLPAHCGISRRISMRRLVAARGSAASFSLRVGKAGHLLDPLFLQPGADEHVVGGTGRVRSRAANCHNRRLEGARVGVAADGDVALLLGIALLIFSMASTSSRRGTAEPISYMPKSSWSVTETFTPSLVATTEMPFFSGSRARARQRGPAESCRRP